MGCDTLRLAPTDLESPPWPGRPYPKWQAWMREKQPRLLVIWGNRRDVPKAEVHVLEAGHFALDVAADEIAAIVLAFMQRAG